MVLSLSRHTASGQAEGSEKGGDKLQAACAQHPCKAVILDVTLETCARAAARRWAAEQDVTSHS